MRTRMNVRLAFSLVIASTQLASLDRAHAGQICEDLFYKSPFVKVQDSDALRLQNKDGSIAVFPANSYYRQTPFRKIVDFVLSRRADVQARMDEALTEGHARNGNTFQKKNPKTEKYDQEFAPHVNGAVIPLDRAFFDQQIESMGPVARSLRFLLQRIYSSGDMFTRYRSDDAAAKNQAFREIVAHLEIGSLPAHEQRRLVDIVSESVYFEPAMVDGNLKEYGFLPVIGFDAAIDTLQRVTAIYYEFNSGTPSGLSNNVQLLELVRQKDPELFAKFKDQILDDDTFRNLRDAISRNALKYTKQSDGISVIIGPGSFNGANPDVAAISAFSGMPLVRSQDLYVGRDGFVHLDTGPGRAHPKVTGIYGRVEESAFLNSAKDGIGWITPNLKDNEDLGRKWGLPLRNGVNYAWKTNERGEKIGVEVDSKGQPVVAQYMLGQIGRDPSRPDVEQAESFASLIKNRKLYFSGLGGRVIDDKRVFEIINRYLADRFKTPGSKAPVAGPPRTLTDREIGEFYASPEKFVVKVPDESGGVGVYLGPLLSKAELQAVVAKVKKDREEAKRTGQQPVLTIQDFTTAAVMTTPAKDPRGTKWATTVPDWRFFMFMDDQGRVRGGANSFLVRAAKRLSPSTNTSQGAGYGIGVVLDPAAKGSRPIERSVLPARPASVPLSATSRKHLNDYFDGLREIIEIADSGAGAEAKLREAAPFNPYNLGDFNPDMRWNRIEIQVQLHKEVLAELGLENSRFMTVLKKFNAGEITLAQFRREIHSFRAALLAKTDFQHEGVRELVQAAAVKPKSKLRPSLHAYFRTQGAKVREPLALESFLRDHVTLEKTEPTILREVVWGDQLVDLVQVGRVVRTTDAKMNSLIEELRAEGGEIRYVRQRSKDGKYLDAPPSAEFGIDAKGRPVIDIDLNQSQLVVGVAHEMVHFRDWLDLFRQELRDGKSREDASRSAITRMIDDVEFQRGSEQRAVKAELQTEKEVGDSPFNTGTRRPSREWESVNGFTYASRVLYPDVVAISRVLGKIRWEKGEEKPSEKRRAAMAVAGREKAERYLTNVILGAAEYRAKTVSYLRGVRDRYATHPDASVRRRAEHAGRQAELAARQSLFSFVLRDVDLRIFAATDTVGLLRDAYQAQVEKLVAIGRLAPQAELPPLPELGSSLSAQQQQQ